MYPERTDRLTQTRRLILQRCSSGRSLLIGTDGLRPFAVIAP